jgi:hypothetical protein
MADTLTADELHALLAKLDEGGLSRAAAVSRAWRDAAMEAARATAVGTWWARWPARACGTRCGANDVGALKVDIERDGSVFVDVGEYTITDDDDDDDDEDGVDGMTSFLAGGEGWAGGGSRVGLSSASSHINTTRVSFVDDRGGRWALERRNGALVVPSRRDTGLWRHFPMPRALVLRRRMVGRVVGI